MTNSKIPSWRMLPGSTGDYVFLRQNGTEEEYAMYDHHVEDVLGWCRDEDFVIVQMRDCPEDIILMPPDEHSAVLFALRFL